MNKLALYWWNKTIYYWWPHFVWPIITKKIEKLVIKQLYENISIYNRSWIFEEFENNFWSYHNIKYSLLFNSWTSSIFAMFESIWLKPWDEILCPDYTFFATISPIVYNWATPIFCDCKDDWNIDHKDILKKITNKTKAIIITHMWWIPCDMDEITKICKDNNLILLEDCSHAHWAKYKWKKVWTFWDISAWSLQWQKTVTWWEWWVFATNNEEYYYKWLLLWHYNKRCKTEIPKDNSLYKFSVTGFWQKFRAHPLAIVIANEELSKLNNYLETRRKFANLIIKELIDIDFLEMPKFENKNPSWYAFVMQYDKKKANNISIDLFFTALQEEWLFELDRPWSTCPVHNFPLFKNIDEVNPRLYKNKIKEYSDKDFPNAIKYYNNALKLPIWSEEKDLEIVQKYIDWIKKVSYYVKNEPNIFKK